MKEYLTIYKMNREIKFRAWVIDGKTMVAWEDMLKCEEPTQLEHSFTEWFNEKGNVILMQLTGLKDKNGKEIYEGDILKYNEFGEDVFYYVKYSVEGLDIENYIGAYFLCDGRYSQLICNINRPYQYAEVAGNVYESKLLTI